MTGQSVLGVVGAGAWGTALAQMGAGQRAPGQNREVRLWGRNPARMAEIAAIRENRTYLPGVPLSPAIRPTSRLEDLAGCDPLLIVVPAQTTRATLTALSPFVGPEVMLVLAAKGIEQGSLKLMSEVAAEILPGHPLAVLSGPTFAAEVARGLPTAVTLAAKDLARAERLVEELGTRSFRPYASDDVVGAEVGGAVKNVIAIACGIVEGLGLGENARSALITRALAEVTRLACAKGARATTLMGLSGLGDLTLSCGSPQSRNFSLGLAIARGEDRKAVLAEGYFSAPPVLGLARALGVEMPICEAVHALLHEGAALAPQIDRLLSRPFRGE